MRILSKHGLLCQQKGEGGSGTVQREILYLHVHMFGRFFFEKECKIRRVFLACSSHFPLLPLFCCSAHRVGAALAPPPGCPPGIVPLLAKHLLPPPLRQRQPAADRLPLPSAGSAGTECTRTRAGTHARTHSTFIHTLNPHNSARPPTRASMHYALRASTATATRVCTASPNLR